MDNTTPPPGLVSSPSFEFDPDLTPFSPEFLEHESDYVIKKLETYQDNDEMIGNFYQHYQGEVWDAVKRKLIEQNSDLFEKIKNFYNEDLAKTEKKVNQATEQNNSVSQIKNFNKEEFNNLILSWHLEKDPYYKSELTYRIIEHANKQKLYIKTERQISEYLEVLKDSQIVKEQDIDQILSSWFVPDDWLSNVPEQEWLIPGFIPLCYSGIISGHVGSGKSTLSTQVCISFILGSEFLGQTIEKQGIVIYCCSDEDAVLLKRRLKEQGLPESEINKSFYPLTQHNENKDYWDVTKLSVLEAYLQKITILNPTKPILIVMDSMTSLVSEPTNNDLVSEGINKELGRIIKLSRKFNSTLLFITHSRNDGAKPYGIVEKLMDYTWLIHRQDDDKAVLTKRKGRDMDQIPDEIYLCFDRDTKLFTIDDNPNGENYLSDQDNDTYTIIQSHYEEYNTPIKKFEIINQYKERYELDISSEYPGIIARLRDQGLIKKVGSTKQAGWRPVQEENDDSKEIDPARPQMQGIN